MTPHTPGPWKVGDRAPYVEVWGPMRMGASPILASMESEPREANALLMAAAPELLAELRTARDVLHSLPQSIRIVQADKIERLLLRIDAAIAKATVPHSIPVPA